ncbi:hypothetical protein LCGC14_1749440 [marine sediment metagenome]|uniref:Uncharacterized protein n=1 Tax=marine sediment metagenome TaxID=412755 RepID=A0A0F9H4D7_9ZZZZ
MNNIAYKDVERKIIASLDRCNLVKRRMYWRGFIWALSEYCDLGNINYETLSAIIDRYGSEKKDHQVKGKLIP